jgi:hypothetical protein
MLRKIGRMLYTMFVVPFVRLGAWIRMKWEWRGMAIVTQKDWDRVIRKTAEKYGDTLRPLRGLDLAPIIDGKPASPEFWARREILRVLRNDPSMKEARDILTRAEFPNMPGCGRAVQMPHISLEEAERAIEEMLKKHNITYTDLIVCVGPEGGLQCSFKAGRSNSGDNPK